MVEAGDTHAPGRVQQRLRAHHVGAEEAARVDDGQAVVGLGGEVHHHVDGAVAQHPLDKVEVADVPLHEAHPLSDAVEVGLVAGVGEQVVGDDGVPRVGVEPVAHEVGADEAGGAGHEQVHDPNATGGSGAGRFTTVSGP